MSDNHASKRSNKKGRHKDGVVLRVSDIEKECDRLRRRPRAALYPLLPITEPLKGKGVGRGAVGGSKPHHRKHCRKRKPRRLRVRLRRQVVAPTTQQHHHHHHHYQPRTGTGVCHHDPLLCGRGALAVASMQELRWPAPSAFGRRRRCRDVEAGPSEDDKERRSRRIVSVIVASVASFILMMCVALVAVTLRLTPAIDEMVRKGNEEIYRSMSAGASTPAPSTEGATNHTTPPSG